MAVVLAADEGAGAGPGSRVYPPAVQRVREALEDGRLLVGVDGARDRPDGAADLLVRTHHQGLGGGARYAFDEIDSHSGVRFNADQGAMLVTANQAQITFQFFTRAGVLVDTCTVIPEN